MTPPTHPAIETKTVPREALCFAGEILQADAPPEPPKDGGATLYPFSMLARTGGLAQHPWWGPCVHDFEGMIPGKDRITVDYCHDPEQILGYADSIKLEADGLKLAGALVSVREHDQAADVFAKAKAGIPFETSILTNSDGLLAEFIPDGLAATVNGQTFEGPLTVFRKWELWGVAILPYGSDRKTQVAFAAGETVNVKTIKGAETVTNPTAPARTGKDYMNRFGQQRGALWFANGLGWEEAVEKFEGEITDENKQLAEELALKEQKIAELTEELSEMKGKYEALMTESEKTKTELSGFKRGSEPLAGTTPTPGTKPAAPSKFAGLGKAAAFAEATERRLRARGLISDN